MRINYFIIPLITLATALSGSFLTSGGMSWYKTIKLPSFAPPGSFIGAVWTIIFILSTISALIVYNKGGQKLWPIMIIFLINAGLNVFWSYLFFNQHLLGAAIFEAAVLDVSVIVLIILIWPISKAAAWLLAPYAVWTAFATYLTYLIWGLNR